MQTRIHYRRITSPYIFRNKHGCAGCDIAKTVKSNSRKRKPPIAIVVAADAIARPFGAMVHLDHTAMEPKSEAARAARYTLNIRDKRASFCVAYPSNTRDTDTIMDASYLFDDDSPVIRRWWTDAAPEFAKAARTIRTIGPLAHYKSAPYRPQAKGRAERFNRLMIEWTRCFLLQFGLGERWWPLAIVLF